MFSRLSVMGPAIMKSTAKTPTVRTGTIFLSKVRLKFFGGVFPMLSLRHDASSSAEVRCKCSRDTIRSTLPTVQPINRERMVRWVTTASQSKSLSILKGIYYKRKEATCEYSVDKAI